MHTYYIESLYLNRIKYRGHLLCFHHRGLFNDITLRCVNCHDHHYGKIEKEDSMMVKVAIYELDLAYCSKEAKLESLLA